MDKKIKNYMEDVDEEPKVFSSGYQMFDPDPEINETYYSIYDKDGKLIGRSNRMAALLRFISNCKRSEYEGAYVIIDGWNRKMFLHADGSMECDGTIFDSMHYCFDCIREIACTF